MRLGRRYGLSAVQKTEIWRRRKAGESLHEIGRAFRKDHGSIHFLLSQRGGIVPAVRRRSERTLTQAEKSGGPYWRSSRPSSDDTSTNMWNG